MAEHDDDILTLVAEDGGSVCVKRCLFLQKSAYYRALAISGMKDSKNRMLTFDILSKASLAEVADFFIQISKNSLSETSGVANVVNIDAGLEAASYLQIDEMIEKYCTFLIDSLNSSTWFHALNLCQKYSFAKYNDIVLTFVCEHFQLCCVKEEFLCLTYDEVEFILQSDKTKANSEAIIFNAALKWLMCDSSRNNLIPRLLKNIRFELMNDCELKESKTLLDSVNLESNIADLLFNSFNPSLLRMRCAIPAIVALGGFTKKEFATNRFQVLSTSEVKQSLQVRVQRISSDRSHPLSAIRFRSSTKCRLPRTLCEHGVCIMNGCLYVSGGQVQYHDSGRLTTNEVFVFNPLHQQWSSCARMNYPRSLFYFGELSGFLYAVSGCTASNTDTETVERYTPSQDKWEMMASLEVRVHELAGCRHKDNIYVSGGFRGPSRGHVDLVWRYDPSTNQWTKRASMLVPRSYHAMVEVCDRLFVMGGVRYLGDDRFQDILDGEMYDPSLNQWSRVLRLYYPASCMSSVVIDNDVLLFGGHSFVYNKEHDFVQVVSVNKVTSSKCMQMESCSSEGPKKKTRSNNENLSFNCQILNFEAHGIFYFGLCELKLPQKFVDQFH